jgi:hypothetical protein
MSIYDLGLTFEVRENDSCIGFRIVARTPKGAEFELGLDCVNRAELRCEIRNTVQRLENQLEAAYLAAAELLEKDPIADLVEGLLRDAKPHETDPSETGG